MSKEMVEEHLKLIQVLAKAKTPKHVIQFLYSTECPHCQAVMPLLEAYVGKHPETILMKIDATTEEGTRYLEAAGKGAREVPLAIIDDKFTVKGETNFIERVTYAIQLSENMPKPKEATQSWMLQA